MQHRVVRDALLGALHEKTPLAPSWERGALHPQHPIPIGRRTAPQKLNPSRRAFRPFVITPDRG
jgi:hypothetical protein